LTSVAEKFLLEVKMEEETRMSCVLMCSFFHEKTLEWADTFHKKEGRKYYVTPTSFIELIKTF
jgi:dynein heavy chain